MRASLPGLGAVFAAALAASAAHAQGCYVPYIPKAPDMCGPGSYGPNLNGLLYGPNYCVFPPFPPYQGELPAPPPGSCIPQLPGMPPAACMQPQVTFPTHPFARGPRDYFMYYAPDYYGTYSPRGFF